MPLSRAPNVRISRCCRRRTSRGFELRSTIRSEFPRQSACETPFEAFEIFLPSVGRGRDLLPISFGLLGIFSLFHFGSAPCGRSQLFDSGETRSTSVPGAPFLGADRASFRRSKIEVDAALSGALLRRRCWRAKRGSSLQPAHARQMMEAAGAVKRPTFKSQGQLSREAASARRDSGLRAAKIPTPAPSLPPLGKDAEKNTTIL